MHRRSLIVIASVIMLSLLLSACGQTANMPDRAGGGTSMAMAPISSLPAAMQNAPVRVRAAYQFAVANPDALKNVPCYCGCGAMGHTSNLSCYVKERRPDGQITFDGHALGCSLCVDISQDVMRMTGEGRSPTDIRANIVATYSKFGPPNQ